MATSDIGFFGKLPSHGDFIDRGLPRAFISRWDQWLQGVFASSRQHLGAAWLDYYLSAPLWRFVLTPGVCGPAGWQGLIMPSVDRANRHFPLTIARPRDSADCTLAMLLDHAAWFHRCEEVALGALDPTVDADTLFARLQAITPAAPAPHRTPCPSPAADDALAWQFALPPQPVAQTLAYSLTEALLRHTGIPYSLWWSEGSQVIDRSLLIHRGLPTNHDFTALLDGRWVQWGWGQCQVGTAAAPTSTGEVPA